MTEAAHFLNDLHLVSVLAIRRAWQEGSGLG